MTPEQFVYWLQGFVELSGNGGPTPEQWKSICDHLGTCFNKVTPPVPLPGLPFDWKTGMPDPMGTRIIC
ncbi:hypothetical protein V8918_02875 [Ralstonia mannitolilytica]|uniref:hypothetical protein n=1 Tax=Ralstonia mannitolilytica TaxID=105219 RepID=UPI003B83E011